MLTIAARAAIHERCASALLHDVRGTLQALFSAFELLGRSARTGEANSARVERAWELARRAMSHHEKSVLDVLQMLTLQPAEPAAVDLPALVNEAVHLLRNQAASKYVTVAVTASPEVRIVAQRAKLQSLLIGLLTAAIEETPTGAELRLSVARQGGDAVVTFGSHAGLCNLRDSEDLSAVAAVPLRPRELTLWFAKAVLAENRGRMQIDASAYPAGTVTLYHPCL